MFRRFKVSYNAPFVLTFTLFSFGVLVINGLTGGRSTEYLFIAQPDFSWTDPLDYSRLMLHIAGHQTWEHFASNFFIILLVGPILEEKYGTKVLLWAALATALVTGVVHAIFFQTFLLGASGVAFMMILLASLVNFKGHAIPLTFILVAVLFLGNELAAAVSEEDNISQFSHIVGGLVGSCVGFLQGYLREHH